MMFIINRSGGLAEQEQVENKNALELTIIKELGEQIWFPGVLQLDDL